VIEEVLAQVGPMPVAQLEDILEVDRLARQAARAWLAAA
jgi:hypothetical protein